MTAMDKIIGKDQPIFGKFVFLLYCYECISMNDWLTTCKDILVMFAFLVI